jgi:arsenate reductase
MAEGFLRHLAGNRFEVASAGTEATRVHPLAVRAMRDVGIDLSPHTSKTLDALLDLCRTLTGSLSQCDGSGR